MLVLNLYLFDIVLPHLEAFYVHSYYAMSREHRLLLVSADLARVLTFACFLLDESEDDTKANSSSVEKKTAAPPAPAMTTATPPVAPPVAQPAPPTRTKIPYKSAGNFSTPKPTNTVPTKKPMGKPLSLIKEKHGKVSFTLLQFFVHADSWQFNNFFYDV